MTPGYLTTVRGMPLLILRNPAAALKQIQITKTIDIKRDHIDIATMTAVTAVSVNAIRAVIYVAAALKCAVVLLNAVNVGAVYTKDAANYATVAAVIMMMIDVDPTL